MWQKDREQILHQINQIAVSTDTTELVHGLLSVVMEHSQSPSGVVFLLEPATSRLRLSLVLGEIIKQPDFCREIASLQDRAAAWLTSGQDNPLLNNQDYSLVSPQQDHWGKALGQQPVAAIPITTGFNMVGVMLLIGIQIQQMDQDMIRFVLDRLTTEIYKSQLLNSSHFYNERLLSLTQVLGELGATLNEDELLTKIIRNGRLLTNAEACSLFLFDEPSNEYVLYEASNLNEVFDGVPLEIRVPRGQGVIGHVIENGEPLIVNDTANDERHFKLSDSKTGFRTRSLLAVPMKSHTINLNSLQEDVYEHIIGGLEAVNKVNGHFNQDDQSLLQILADQAATILEIARAYTAINEIFLDVTKALSAAIDAKDPYTIGHSLRVSEYAAVMAQELNLSPPTIQKVRLGGLLHDIGKIGIPDAILQKPGKLSDEEYQIIMNHPAIGGKIMEQVHKLHQILPGMIEHHERLDGSGYPNGLEDSDISLLGRMIAVADVFDALTSDRPYRKAMSAKQAIGQLVQEHEHRLDERCINALILAYNKGIIKTQHEKEAGTNPAFY